MSLQADQPPTPEMVFTNDIHNKRGTNSTSSKNKETLILPLQVSQYIRILSHLNLTERTTV